MGQSLAQLVSEIEAAAGVARNACAASDYATAREAARVILSCGSKLHARCSAVLSLRDEGFAVAEVDRALAKERATRPEAVKGDTPLPFPKAPRTPRRKA